MRRNNCRTSRLRLVKRYGLVNGAYLNDTILYLDNIALLSIDYLRTHIMCASCIVLPRIGRHVLNPISPRYTKHENIPFPLAYSSQVN